MQNYCVARPLSSSFGTVSMGKTIQILDVLALDNLFIGAPCVAVHPARTADAAPHHVMTMSQAVCLFSLYKKVIIHGLVYCKRVLYNKERLK